MNISSVDLNPYEAAKQLCDQDGCGDRSDPFHLSEVSSLYPMGSVNVRMGMFRIGSGEYWLL
jgi:hypothetical protein